MTPSSSHSRSLAHALAPALVEATDGQLRDLAWFKADWQRGGAATATGVWEWPDGRTDDVVIKLPVNRREYTWTTRLQAPNAAAPLPIVPRLFARGLELGAYDLRWLVMERFPAGPLGLKWSNEHIPRIARAIARFQHAASAFTVDEPPKTEPWPEMIAASIDQVRLNELEDEARWIAALQGLQASIDSIVTTWRARDVAQWLHGDAHLANAMSRDGIDHGDVTLIDLAEVHAGHWIEDAVYFERQLWARPERLDGCDPVAEIARERRELGLPVEDEWPRLALIRRGLLAATAPDFLRSEGHPRHLHACLEWLERSVREL